MKRSSESMTGSTLLVLLKAPTDASAWDAFVKRYGPKIFDWCRQRGIQEADAQDVTQEVLTKLTRKLAQFAYDPQRGSFRGWLRTLTRNALNDYLDSQDRPGGVGVGNSGELDALQSTAARDDLMLRLQEVFDHELLAEAQARVQLRVTPRDWKLFQDLAVEQKPGRTVAEELKMSVAAVLMAKKRVQDKLREEIQRLEEKDFMFREETP